MLMLSEGGIQREIFQNTSVSTDPFKRSALFSWPEKWHISFQDTQFSLVNSIFLKLV